MEAPKIFLFSALCAAAAAFPLAADTLSARGQTIFTTQLPALSESHDGVPYELGTKFQAGSAGLLNALRFWKTPSETGIHTGNLWSADGTLLASATFTNETASGWQEAPLDAPVFISANTTYVVTVNSSFYPFTAYGLAAPIVNGLVSTVADGANGVFGPPAEFPTSTYHAANYFRDVAFTPTLSARGQTILTTQTPEGEFNDGVPYELGTKFRADLAGTVNAIRFFKTPSETGVHTGHIWSADGALLASATFTDETPSGWQEASLDTPLPIAAGTTYVVTVNSSFYPFTGYGLADPIVNGPVSTVADGANGVFGPPGEFPTSTYHAANYFRDVAFTPAPRLNAVYTTLSDWQDGFQGQIAVSNPRAKRIETWSLVVDFTDRQITQIWGASHELLSSTVSGSHTIHRYRLTSPDWNKRIAPGGTNLVGFLAAPGGVQPGDVTIVSRDDVAESAAETASYALPSANVAITREGDWQAGAVLKLKITNPGTAPITDWKLTLYFPRGTGAIWNATLRSASGPVLVFDAQDFPWQKDIPAGGTVEFGFFAAPGALKDAELPLVTDLVSTTPLAASPTPLPPVETLAAPSILSVSKPAATLGLKVTSGDPVRKIEARATRRAIVAVRGSNPYKVKLAKLPRGRTKVKVRAVTSGGKILRKTISVVRR